MSELHFKPLSVTLSASIWNVLPFPGKRVMVIEQRDEVRRAVSFSAFDFEDQEFLWRDVSVSERWWVNLVGVTDDRIVLKVFESTENPDKTSFLYLTAEDGKMTDPGIQQNQELNTNVLLQPFQYLEGEKDFETVKSFLKSKIETKPCLGVEYLEYEGYIIISYYSGDPAAYNNQLVIFNSSGECLYQEEIGTNLKGIGVNTFFMTSGYLFFVKNKTELVTFRIV